MMDGGMVEPVFNPQPGSPNSYSADTPQVGRYLSLLMTSTPKQFLIGGP